MASTTNLHPTFAAILARWAPAPFSWRHAPDLMERLTAAQNHPRNENIDIVTFAGMCDSRAELEAHVVRYEERAVR